MILDIVLEEKTHGTTKTCQKYQTYPMHIYIRTTNETTKGKISQLNILLMVQKSGSHQLRLVGSPIIYKLLPPSKQWLALGFLNHQQ